MFHNPEARSFPSSTLSQESTPEAKAVELVYAVETASAHVEQNIKKQRAEMWEA